MRVGKWGGGGACWWWGKVKWGESGINGGEKLGGHHAKNFRKYDIFAVIAEEYLEISRAMLKSTRVTLSRWRSLSYRNQSIDLFYKSMDWFLYDRDLRQERF